MDVEENEVIALKTVNSLHFNALNKTNSHNNNKHNMKMSNNSVIDVEEKRLLKKPNTMLIVPPNGFTANKPETTTICDNTSKCLNPNVNHLNNCSSSMRRINSKPQHFDVDLMQAHAVMALSRQHSQPVIRRGSFIYSDCSSSAGGMSSAMSNAAAMVKPSSALMYTDGASIRSLASIGMGSTDGKRMVIRKVPTSPVELLNIVSPPTPTTDEYEYDAESYANLSDDPDSLNLKPRRQHWANKMQFVLACVGYSVGLGNIWRFPYLCYKSGGGVFLIPYFLIMVVCGIPMLYMELAIGQFTGRGPIGALGQICPLFKGAGLASVVISFLMSTYYSVIIAYGIYYFFTSLKNHVPWEGCTNRWNTPHCWMPPDKLTPNNTRPTLSRTPSEEFYERKVLQISEGIEDPGSMRWDLVACLLCAWIMVYFAIWKSIKSSAKVRYITATLPFLLIVVFLARSLSLDGADKGMRYFFKPRWELLGDAKVWVNAAAQNFNSFGVAFGSMICFASYNKYNNNILHDTLAVSFVNGITSLLVGIFAFAVIGNIASEQNTSIEDVVTDGPGLIFVVYPQAIAKMPAPQLWAVLFFFMLLCLGLNSQFAIVEVVVTSIQDGFPGWIKKKLVCHEMLVLIVCVVSFLCGLPNTTKGGIYFFQLIDHYAASISIMYLAFFEVIAIAWFYGVWRLSRNIENMNAKTPSLYFKFCWMIAAPLFIMAVWVFCLLDYESPTYSNGDYHYPVWAIVLGWVISSLSIACIPAFAIYVFFKSEGETWREKLRNSLMPDLYECKICGDHNCEHIEEEREMQEISPMLILRLDSQNENNQSRTEVQANNIRSTVNPKV